MEGRKFAPSSRSRLAKVCIFRAVNLRPIRRTGFPLRGDGEVCSAERTQGDDEPRRARNIARFNPIGIFLRRWPLDDVHIDGGEVDIQIYEPKPQPTPAKPWDHVSLPDRVHLRRVSSEPAAVT